MNYKILHERVSKKRKVSATHIHSKYELYYLIKGDTKYFIGDEIFHLHEGNFIFVPKNTYHYADSETCLHNERFLIFFDDLVFDETMQPVLGELSKTKLISIDDSDMHIIRDIVKKIETENASSGKYRNALVKTHLRDLLTSLCRYKSPFVKNISEYDKFIYSVSEFISNNYAENITLNSISKQFALSEAHLSRKFKATIGMGLKEYITHVRILKAEKLLTQTNLPMTEIAGLCGFGDSNYFSTVFKKKMGVTPYKYSLLNKDKKIG